MSKKQILVIFTGSMELGGIERSLLGLLGTFDYDKYDVDLFLYGHHGPLFSMIDQRVNILPEVKELAYLRESFTTKIIHGCFYSAALRLRDKFISRSRKVSNDSTWKEIMMKCAPGLPKHYDLAISFFRPFDFIENKVNATVKMGWIHTDYSNKSLLSNAVKEDYKKVQLIAAVSEQCRNSFYQSFPEMSEKVVVVENILSKQLIHESADKVSVKNEMPDNGRIKLLSIGRFSKAKNFDNVPDICRRICEGGMNVVWYLIGFGADEQLIRERIEESNMQEHVIILGKKDNPYPYIKECDLYVQPSRYEGKCVSVIEAQILCKPVVITNYATSSSQLENGVDGIIVPKDNVNCAEGIIQLLKNPEQMNELSANCKIRDYTNAKEVEKLYRIIEEL